MRTGRGLWHSPQAPARLKKEKNEKHEELKE